MPRNKKSARDREVRPGEPRVFGAEAPAWAELDGYEVRTAFGSKAYRCPGCDHEVRASAQHLVVVPRAAVDERRHWHTECWRRERRRLG